MQPEGQDQSTVLSLTCDDASAVTPNGNTDSDFAATKAVAFVEGVTNVGYNPEPEDAEVNIDNTKDENNGSLRLHSLTTPVINRVNDASVQSDAKLKKRFKKCCKLCCSRCYTCLKPVMWKYHPKPEPESSRLQRFTYGLMCPPHGLFASAVFILIAIALGFGLLWAIAGSDGLPGGQYFGLFVLFVMCILAGHLVELIRLPPLFGMLIMGGLLGNVPYINFARFISPSLSSTLRTFALGIILTRAGLGLNPAALRRMSCVVVRLFVFPCITEAAFAMVAAHFILGFPWIWGLMLGFVLGAVSPAVVVPSLLNLAERGFGVEKGIPTLIIAAASLNAVLSISAFSVCLGIAFANTSSLALTIVGGPLQALGGVLYGIIVGIILWYIPSKTTNQVVLKRTGLLLAAGVFVLYGSTAAKLDSAGTLGCLTVPLVVALRWAKELPPGQSKLPSEALLANLWIVFQPLLFGLIGAKVDISKIPDFKIVGLGIAIIVIGLLGRLIVAYLCSLGTPFNRKERLFVPVSWIPKATVQALIGSVAYDTAVRMKASEEYQEMGMQILIVAVVAIIITAPLGAAAIALSGPRLLQRSGPEQPPSNVETVGTHEQKADEENNHAAEVNSDVTHGDV